MHSVTTNAVKNTLLFWIFAENTSQIIEQKIKTVSKFVIYATFMVKNF